MNIQTIARSWIDELIEGDKLGPNCPKVYRDWVENGIVDVLKSEPALKYRKKSEQLPSSREHMKFIRTIYEYFKDDPYAFEYCAAKIASLIEEIQASTHATVMAMEQGIESVEKGITLIFEAGKTIETAIINVKETVDSVKGIALSSHQQSLSTNQVTQSIVSINKGTKETAIVSKQALRDIGDLNRVHQELLRMISLYKI